MDSFQFFKLLKSVGTCVLPLTLSVILLCGDLVWLVLFDYEATLRGGFVECPFALGCGDVLRGQFCTCVCEVPLSSLGS